jgi:hypothetical protein
MIDITVQELLELLDHRYGTTSIMKTLPLVASNQPEYLNVEGCAALTGYKPDYIRQLVFQRAIPFYKNRKLLRFLRSEIINWMCAKKVTPTSDRAQSHVSGSDIQLIPAIRRHKK